MSPSTHPEVVVITGGASGFGLACAAELAARGSHVVLLDIDGDRAEAAAADLAATHGVRAIGRRVDVSSSTDVDAAAATVDREFGRCDLLWANVAVQHFGAVETTSDDVWRWMLDVNVVGSARTVRSFLPLVRRGRAPRIVFTASVNALAVSARLGAYQAGKFAVVGLAETVRMEHAAEGIGVTVVYPAGMMTRHLESSALARPSALGAGIVSDDDIAAMMASRPMTEADLTTADDAARVAVQGVLAGEPHVVTHGDLGAAVAEHHAAIETALAQLSGRRHR